VLVVEKLLGNPLRGNHQREAVLRLIIIMAKMHYRDTLTV